MTATDTLPAIGARIAFRKTMTVAEQAMFTGISGNLGSQHVDATRARAEGAPGMIAFELAVAALATTCLARLGGPSRRIGHMALSFLAPVPVGATVEASAEVIAAGAEGIVCQLVCAVDGAGTAVTGEARLVPLAVGA